MRIALYAGTFVPDKDGASKTVHQLVRSIREAGHEVVVWSSDVPPEVAVRLGVRKTFSLPIPMYPAYRFGLFKARTWADLDRFKPDLIHLSAPDLAAAGFLSYGRRRRLPVVSAYHTDFSSYLGYFGISFLRKPLWSSLRWFYNRCDLVLAPTEKVRGQLTRRRIRNVELWSRGIHSDRYHPGQRSEELRKAWGAEDKRVVLFASRFVRYKDTEIVAVVHRKLMAERGASVRTVLIGSGPEEETLRRLMPEAIFPGYLTGLDLAQAYASADLFFFPSTTETFGNVVLEAMASGLPCVVSDRGGCMEIVGRSGGGLVARARDPVSFLSRCLSLLDDAGLYARCRENGLAFARQMTWPTINGSLLARYEELAARAKRRAERQGRKPGAKRSGSA